MVGGISFTPTAKRVVDASVRQQTEVSALSSSVLHGMLPERMTRIPTPEAGKFYLLPLPSTAC